MVIHDDRFRHFANMKTLYIFTLMKILTLLKHFVYQILNFKFKYIKMQTEIRIYIVNTFKGFKNI